MKDQEQITKSKLPIDDKISDFLALIRNNSSLVLTAAPGAGKTTRIPVALKSITQKKILILEPRRIAALNAAAWIAEENSWELGKEVGYQVRYDNNTTNDTQIIFITEALLTRKFISNPDLNEFEYIILDEFHERSIHTDLAIGLLKELQSLSRPDLKIIVMSATMNATKVSEFLDDCPILDAPGKNFELAVQYSNESQIINLEGTSGLNLIEGVANQIKIATQNSIRRQSHLSPNHILVFLPGIGEIQKVQMKIESWANENSILVYPLHGSLTIEEQKKVLRPSEKQKIVLATNIAESALTIDGVSVVIDTGLAKILHYNFNSGISSLDTQRISKASAVQRSGRAARQGPGIAYRMWTKLDENSMSSFEEPEIYRVDIVEVVLFLANIGITDFKNFSWYELPEMNRIELAIEQLQMWGALDETQGITNLGKKMIKIPLHPRHARLYIEGETLGCVNFAREICALLEERDILQGKSSEQRLDLYYRWNLYKEKPDLYRNVSRLIELLKKQNSAKSTETNAKQIHNTKYEQLLEKLLIAAYSDHIVHSRSPNDPKEKRGVLCSGIGIALPEHAQWNHSEFFFALRLAQINSKNDLKVHLVSPLSKTIFFESFKTKIKEDIEIKLNEQTNKFEKILQKKFMNMPVETPRYVNPTSVEIEALLPEFAYKKWDLILSSNEALGKWFKRFLWYQSQLNINVLSDDIIKNVLTDTCYGEGSVSALFSKDLTYFFENTLRSSDSSSPSQQSNFSNHKNLIDDFHSCCPEKIALPNGKTARIEYFVDKNPTIEAKIQDLFGWKETPKIFHSKIPLTLVILGPNYRPVQITQDLSQFWKSSYLEIRKELRGRYPKHKWPEDPFRDDSN